MTYVNLSPNASSSNTGAVTGAASAHAALSDDSDSSYITFNPGEGCAFEFENLSLPAGGVVVLARLHARCRRAAPFGAAVKLNSILDAGRLAGTSTIVNWGTIAEASMAQLFGDLTDADVDGAEAAIGIESGGVFVDDLVMYELYLRVLYLTQPNVTVDSPSGTINTNIAQIDWTPEFDPDGQAGPAHYQVKVFTDAQYGAGGFNPETSTPTLSKTGSDGATNVLFFQSLPDDTYRAYVKVAGGNAPDFWSDWVYSQFTVDVAKPGDPSIVLTPEPDQGRMKIDLDDTAGDATTNLFELVRSTDGTNWENVRTVLGDGKVTPTGGTATVYDYEAPNGVPVTYRARAYNSSYPSYSDWSTDTDTWTSAHEWIKHPYRPSLNVQTTIREYPDSNRAANQGVHRSLGSTKAFVVEDVRGPETGQLVVMTESLEERDALKALLDEGGPYLIQVPAWSEMPDRWVAFNDTASVRISDKAFVPYHDETLPWTEVATPEGEVLE